ncbi:hypothetical protein [Thaumasiovibrio subtropicus]|uniref:hypothetical protein n=1 Tax=Thaumasiovibrio subtropicus TaxID=1891207 RepID=UPI00131B9BB7|nr:hypothetical protein [Thaumasiovibrio subtropicus]
MTKKPQSAFLISSDQPMSSGHRDAGIFCHVATGVNSRIIDRIVDFICYENTQDREPVVAIDTSKNDLKRIINQLKKTEYRNLVRDYDPRWIVHSTSIENGEAILCDGVIKSQQRLNNERNVESLPLGYAHFGEPLDYLNHVNFGAFESPMPEVVVRSNQTGEMGGFDMPYQPGYRFYIDAHKLIESGRVLRTGAPFLKAEEAVDLDAFVVAHVDSGQFKSRVWTPNAFTRAANDVFARLRC